MAHIAWFGALLILCYWPILYRMGVQWATDENMGHGFFVPIFAGYVAWQHRAELLAEPRKPNCLRVGDCCIWRFAFCGGYSGR